MKKWIASANETFDMIAYMVYGTSEVTGILLEYNPKYADRLIMEGGEEINLPEIEEEKQGAEWL